MPSAVLIRAPLVLAPAVRLVEPLPLTDPAQQPLLPWASDPPDDVPEPVVEPTLRRVANRFASAVVEVLRGRRPLVQLEPHLDPRDHALLDGLCGSGLRPGLRLASVRVGQPADDVLEAAVRLELAGESRAAALRIVRRDEPARTAGSSWRLVTVELALDDATILRTG